MCVRTEVVQLRSRQKHKERLAKYIEPVFLIFLIRWHSPLTSRLGAEVSKLNVREPIVQAHGASGRGIHMLIRVPPARVR